ncbi:MAG: hypothetical protein JJE52_06495 [Acidimicrobiia bacterium]|nr:hypothetical protein [Acidimicrobiia bacterium]
MARVPDATAVGDALTRVFGGGLTIGSLEPIQPWAIARVHIDSTGEEVPASVIVKWLRQNEAGFRTDPAQLANERFALEFVTQTGLDLGPGLHGHDGDIGWITDWEMAGFGNALIDAAALWVPGSMWMTVQEPDAELDDVYRTALAVGVDAADDDAVFGRHLAAACLAIAIDRAQRLPQLDQRPPGHHSRVQMIAALDAAARVATRRGTFADLAGWVADATGALRRRWPDADVEVPDAYTRRE